VKFKVCTLVDHLLEAVWRARQDPLVCLRSVRRKIGQGRGIAAQRFGIYLCRGIECIAAHPGQEVQRREEHADAGGEEEGLLLGQSRPRGLRRSCRHRY
jgi:hypothetical protein